MTPAEALIKFLRSHGILKEDPPPNLLATIKEFPIWGLSRHNLLNEADAIRTLKEHLGIEYVDLEVEEASGNLQCKEFVSEIRSSTCWKGRLIPIRKNGTKVILAMANPFDRGAIDEIAFATSFSVEARIAEESKIVSLLAKYFPQHNIDLSDEDDESGLDIDRDFGDVQNLDTSSPDAKPIVKLTNKILKDAIGLDVSDIHLEPNESCLAVRFRIDGILQDIVTIPRHLQANVIARLKVLSGMNISEKRKPQDGRMRVKTEGRQIDMRVSSIPASSGEKIVLRLMQADYSNLSYDVLGMPEVIESGLKKALHRKGKLVLVSGPTGSGKTTTLYVSLNYLRDGTTNITTIEDPIEYKFEHINQIQVNEPAGVTFASSLRAVLRQDPDVVMIGEVRDPETLKIVFQAAQTGHLVLSTVHTNDAPSAISRLVDLGAEPFLLSTSLAGVLAQRLVRKNCNACLGNVDAGYISKHEKIIKRYKIDPSKLKAGKGCQECFFTGFKGRVGIYSYLEVSDDVSEAIYRGSSKEQIVRAAKKSGFLDLDESAVLLLEEGITSLDETMPYMNIDKPEEAPPEIIPDAEAIKTIVQPAQQPAVQEVRIHLDSGQQHFNVGASPARPTGTLAQPRVLVIDDNKSVRKMIATLLKKEMVEVSEAANGLEGLQVVYSHTPDLIVCDLKMPELDGKSFLQKIKSSKSTRDIPVIMLTVDDDESNEIDLLGRGACEFISKKTSPLVIVSRIRKVLGDF